MPDEKSTAVDNKSWKKLMELESKAFKLIEQVSASMHQVAEKTGLLAKLN